MFHPFKSFFAAASYVLSAVSNHKPAPIQWASENHENPWSKTVCNGHEMDVLLLFFEAHILADFVSAIVIAPP